MNNIAIISSSKDTAGINIRKNLIELFDFENLREKFNSDMRVSSLRTRSQLTDVFLCNKIPNKTIKSYLINDDLIFAENIDKRINADIFVFASKHRSKENTPSFAVHPIGNWNKADFGGKEKTLCLSSANLLKRLYLSLIQNSHFYQKNASFELTLEATHHGPYVEKPAVFVEIGSTEKEWSDRQNGEIIAKTIMNGLDKENEYYQSCIVLGGGHYNQAANKLMLRTNYAVGHICPKYALEYLDEEALSQAINETIPKPEIILVDWKGLGQYKQKIIKLLENLNFRYERVQNIV